MQPFLTNHRSSVTFKRKRLKNGSPIHPIAALFISRKTAYQLNLASANKMCLS